MNPDGMNGSVQYGSNHKDCGQNWKVSQTSLSISMALPRFAICMSVKYMATGRSARVSSSLLPFMARNNLAPLLVCSSLDHRMRWPFHRSLFEDADGIMNVNG